MTLDSLTATRAFKQQDRSMFGLVVSDGDLASIGSLLEGVDLRIFGTSELNELFIRHNGAIVALEMPTVLLGSVALSDAPNEILLELNASLSIHFATFGYNFLNLSFATDKRQELLNWLTSRMLLVGRLLLTDGRRVRSALAVLRREHDEAMERFQQLEWSVSRVGTPKRVLRLNIAASSAQIRIGGAATPYGARVRQTLPAHCAGIACVELSIDRHSAGEDDHLGVFLFEGGNPQASHSWTLAAVELQGGWHALFLHHALISREQDMALEVTWIGSDQGSIALHLGSPSVLDEYCAQTANGTRLVSPLAVKLWEMPPGSAVAERVVLPAGGGRPLKVRSRVALSKGDLEGVQRLFPQTCDLDYKIVEFRQDSSDILVHPVAGQPVVAVVRDLNLRGIHRLSALVQVGNRDANPVEFGLAAVGGGRTFYHADQLIREWTVVEPDHFAEVIGTIDLADNEPVNIVFATRMHRDATPNLAWAFFKRIEVVV